MVKSVVKRGFERYRLVAGKVETSLSSAEGGGEALPAQPLRAAGPTNACLYQRARAATAGGSQAQAQAAQDKCVCPAARREGRVH